MGPERAINSHPPPLLLFVPSSFPPSPPTGGKTLVALATEGAAAVRCRLLHRRAAISHLVRASKG